jgi:hypothetical protein
VGFQVRRTALGFQRGIPFGTTTGDRRGDGDTVRVNNRSRACIQSVSCLLLHEAVYIKNMPKLLLSLAVIDVYSL